MGLSSDQAGQRAWNDFPKEMGRFRQVRDTVELRGESLRVAPTRAQASAASRPR